MRGERVLVTGAAGYVGRYLVASLLNEDNHVTALIRKGKPPLLWETVSNLKIVVGDLLDVASLEEAVADNYIIFHLAASLRMFERNRELYRTNILGLKNLLEVLRLSGRKVRFIFGSSIDVERSDTDYARSKREGERIVRSFGRKNPQMNYVIARIGNVFGGEEGGMTAGVAKLLSRDNWRGSLLYHQLSEKSLSLVEMSNLVQKMIQLAEDPEVLGQTATLVDEVITVKELAKRLKKQGLIDGYPQKIPLAPFLLKIWQFLGGVIKRGDLLIYLNMQK